jgi:hypothetical protein
MKTVKIGNLKLSRVICGTNPIYARSHFSKARDMEYRERFDDARAVELLLHCQGIGMNAVDSSANERIMGLVAAVRERSGRPLHLIGSTRVDATSEMRTHEEKLEYLIAQRADICIIHAQYVDAPRVDGEIAGLDRLLDRIHAAGLLAGISTHRVDTVEYCERRRLPIDTYLFPLNIMDRVYPGWEGPDTVADRIRLVQNTPKPFILIKALGAGCIPPAEGIPFVLEHAKPNDVLCIGFASEREAEEVVRIVEKMG